MKGSQDSPFANTVRCREKIVENAIRFRFFGNLDLLPVNVQRLMAKVELETRLLSRYQLLHETCNRRRLQRHSEYMRSLHRTGRDSACDAAHPARSADGSAGGKVR